MDLFLFNYSIAWYVWSHKVRGTHVEWFWYVRWFANKRLHYLLLFGFHPLLLLAVSVLAYNAAPPTYSKITLLWDFHRRLMVQNFLLKSWIYFSFFFKFVCVFCSMLNIFCNTNIGTSSSIEFLNVFSTIIHFPMNYQTCRRADPTVYWFVSQLLTSGNP